MEAADERVSGACRWRLAVGVSCLRPQSEPGHCAPADNLLVSGWEKREASIEVRGFRRCRQVLCGVGHGNGPDSEDGDHRSPQLGQLWLR